MKWKITIVALIGILAPFPYAFSDDVTVEGEVGIEGVYSGVRADEGGRAKFTEYRDLTQGANLFGSMGLGIDSDNYFLRFRAGDMTYDTQFYELEGGMWGRFKLNLFYDEIPHNITFDARTPFLGAGHDTLVGTPNLNFPAWNIFDYSILRHQYGGGFNVDVLRPFFLDVSFERENRDGIKPTGAAVTNPGGIAVELPEPIDYVTNNLKVSAGYSQKPLFLSLNYVHSDFINSNLSLTLPGSLFTGPVAGAPATTFSLPPDNMYDKGAFKGAVSLPFNSRFSANMGFSRGTSDTSIVSLIGSGYTGKVDTVNYDFALTSNPVSFLDAKVYYKYYKRDNKSDDPTGVVNLFLDYNNATYGGELGLRLPEKFYLSGGYKYVKTERNWEGETNLTEVLPYNKDNIYFVNLKWSGLDFLDARIGYERLDRDAQYRTVQSEINPARQFAYAAQNKDTFKAALDILPLENLNVGLDYRYANTDYSDTIYGLRSDKRNEFEVSADYSIGKIAKLNAYGDVEWIKFNQLQFATTTLLPWQANQWDKSWGYGLGAEVYVIPKKLTLIFRHDYLKSNGSVDFTLNNGLFIATTGLGPASGANNDNIDIGRWDDYTLYSLSIRAVYNFTKSVTAMIGYAYQRFWYSDAQLNNYQFVNPPGGPVTGSNGAYLTGAYNGQSYKANLVFGGMTYKF